MRTLVTGATGFIGRHLLPHLDRPVVLSRSGTRQRSTLGALNVTTYDWLPHAGPPPAQAFDAVEAVIHLAGESVAGRWTRAKKRRMFESRVTGTRHLVETLTQLAQPPRVLISASAVGYYGSRGDELLDETSLAGEGFLADLCTAWESAAAAATALGIRVVLLRTGIVLGRDGGALPRMLPPFRLGFGGRLGDGHQWMPWIHVDDMVRAILFLIENATLAGPVNASAPQPVTNAEFTRSLGRTIRRPTWCAVPALVLRLALGEFAHVLLASQRAMPYALARAGFAYQFPELDRALHNIVQA
jgi:uncharacterized protein